MRNGGEEYESSDMGLKTGLVEMVLSRELLVVTERINDLDVWG